jgi:hypothetical protein
LTKALKLLLMIIFAVSLVACGNRGEYSFKGGTQNWDAKLTLRNVHNDTYEEQFVLKYIGAEKVNGNVQYEFETTAGGGKGDTPLHSRGITHNSMSNGAIPLRDSTVKVIVHWNGKTDKFSLYGSS